MTFAVNLCSPPARLRQQWILLSVLLKFHTSAVIQYVGHFCRWLLLCDIEIHNLFSHGPSTNYCQCCELCGFYCVSPAVPPDASFQGEGSHPHPWVGRKLSVFHGILYKIEEIFFYSWSLNIFFSWMNNEFWHFVCDYYHLDFAIFC